MKIRIKNNLTVYTAARAATQLSAALERADRLIINLDDVTDIDSAGLQLLVALKHEARARSKSLELHSFSPAISKTIDRYGLNDFFTTPRNS